MQFSRRTLCGSDVKRSCPNLHAARTLFKDRLRRSPADREDPPDDPRSGRDFCRGGQLTAGTSMPYKLFVGKWSLWRSEPQVSIGQMQQHPSVLRPPCRFRMAVPMVSDRGWICRFDLVRHNNELA